MNTKHTTIFDNSEGGRLYFKDALGRYRPLKDATPGEIIWGLKNEAAELAIQTRDANLFRIYQTLCAIWDEFWDEMYKETK